MKNQLLVTIFTCFFMSAYAQGLNIELGFNDNYDQYPTGITVEEEYTYLIKEQRYINASNIASFLSKIDTTGTVIWEVQIKPNGSNTDYSAVVHIARVIPSENGGVYIAGFGRNSCDTPSPFEFVHKYEADGSLAWIKLWNNRMTYREIIGISLTQENTLFISMTEEEYPQQPLSYIYEISYTGTVVNFIENTPEQLEGFERTEVNHFLAYKTNSLLKFNNDGTADTTILFSTSISGLKALNDTIYVLTQDSIHSFDTHLQILNSTNIAGYRNFSHLKTDSNTIKLLTSSAGDFVILTLDRTLQLTGTFSILNESTSSPLNDFNHLHFSSASIAPLAMFSAIRYLDYSLTSPENTIINRTDIGITDIQTDSIQVFPYPGIPSMYTVYISTSVLLTNFGQETLTDCRINRHVMQDPICGDVGYTRHFSGLNLQPGESVWIPLGVVHNFMNYFSSGPMNINLCFYTSSPNFVTDLTVSNDRYCKSVYLGTVDISEIAQDQPQKILIRVVDLLGREVPDTPNQVLIYVYSDGTTEKIFRVE